MIASRHQNIVENQNTVIENLSFENVEKLKCLRVTITNQKKFAKKFPPFFQETEVNTYKTNII